MSEGTQGLDTASEAVRVRVDGQVECGHSGKRRATMQPHRLAMSGSSTRLSSRSHDSGLVACLRSASVCCQKIILIWF